MERGFDERGQMAVELAVVLPVILIVLVIAIDCAVYLGECARFDHLAAQSVLANATSPSRNSYDASARAQAVQAELSESFAEHDETVSVSSRDAGMPLASMASSRRSSSSRPGRLIPDLQGRSVTASLRALPIPMRLQSTPIPRGSC